MGAQTMFVLRHPDFGFLDILKRAFAGRLVPQDPADEPAAALLARLRREKPTRPAGRRAAQTTLPL